MYESSSCSISSSTLDMVNLLNFSHSNKCFPSSSDGKECACNAGGPGWIPGSGKSHGEGEGNPLQYSCLENSMNGGAWGAIVPWVTRSQTKLSDYHLMTSLKRCVEGDDRGWDGWMASPTQWTWVWVNSRSWWWTGRPGVLWFMGSQRIGHDWATELNWTEWLIMCLSILHLC